MIIWSGLGILIPILAIIGIVVGTVISSLIGHPGIGPGFGLLLAAAGNWGLWKMIYPKQPKVMLDANTGQQVLVTPKHGLFFVPAKIWTWILGILAVPVIVLGAAGEYGSAKNASKPGYKEFQAANGLIASNGKGPHHGNNDTAKQAAAGFSENMKTFSETAFTGGSKKNLMTGGEYLTYCHDTPEAIIVLCHVPSLRSYKSDESKDMLHKLAWMSGSTAAARLDPDCKKKLVVGLRGIASYECIIEGKNGAPLPPGPYSTDTSILYPAFLPSAESKPAK
jgi:hypothetical protein